MDSSCISCGLVLIPRHLSKGTTLKDRRLKTQNPMHCDSPKSASNRARSMPFWSGRSKLLKAVLLILLGLAGSVQALTWHFGYVFEDDAAKKAQITTVMNEAVAVYNSTTNFNVDINVAYHPGVPTAEASYNGELKFGGSINTQVAIHEIAHYLGSGTTWQWDGQFGGGNVWNGAMLKHFVKNAEGPGGEIYKSGVHYYPYGFNYGSEDSPNARRRLPRLIEAMRFDMGFSDGDGDGMSDEWENFKIGSTSQGANGDIDGDGISNRDEWLTEGDPMRACSVRQGHTYLIRSRLSQKLMEVAGMGAGANVRQNAPDGSNFQKWTAWHMGGGYWKFLNVASGKALETGGLSNDAGANIIVWDDLGHDYQQWRVVSDGAAQSKIINKGSRNKVVDVEGGPTATGNLVNISQYHDDIGANNQDWTFEDITPVEPAGALLQAEYKLDGTARDTSSNEFHGTSSGGVTYTTGRVDAQGATFNGTNASIQIPASVDATFTIACWVKTTATGGGAQWYNGMGLVDGEVSGVATDFGLALVTNKIGFGVGNADYTLTSANAVNDGQWHHVVATRDNPTGAMKIFIDGVQQASGTGPVGPRMSPTSLRLGSIRGATGFFNGSLDEVRLYSGILTTPEISRLANVGRTLIASYGFESNAQDASNHGNHGDSANVTYVMGKRGASAAQFDGTSSFVRIPVPVVTDFSVAYWVKTTATGGTGQWWAGKPMIDAEIPGVANDWGIALVGNKAGFGIGNTDATITSGPAINDGIWHHVVATRQAGTIRLYVDGVMTSASTIAPSTARNAPAAVRVGSSLYGNSWFAGAIDDLRFYNYPMSPTEVAAIASAIPEPWVDQAIGLPGSDGYAGYTASIFTVAGTGTGIAGTSDQFHFLAADQSGDRALITRVMTLPRNHDATATADAKAGLMFRGSAAANAPFVALVYGETRGLQFLHRDGAGAAMTQTGANMMPIAAPFWLRLVRTGNSFAASYATTASPPEPENWISLGDHTTILPATVPGGLAVASHTAAKVASATFVGLSATAANTPPTLTDFTDRTINEDRTLDAHPLIVGDAQTAASSLVLTATSSNQALVPDANLALGGSGSSRSLLVTPIANQTGSTLITLTVTDGVFTVNDTFTLTVQRTPAGEWRFQQFGTTSNTGDAADDADPDHDGINNFFERAFALDPKVSDPPGVMPVFAKEGEFLILTYTKNLAATDLGYQVTWSSGLEEWSSNSVSDELVFTNGNIQRRVGKLPRSVADPERCFLRLVVLP